MIQTARKKGFNDLQEEIKWLSTANCRLKNAKNRGERVDANYILYVGQGNRMRAIRV